MKSGRDRLVLLFLVLAILSSIIAIAGGWRQAIIEPVALVLWLGWRLILSVPQSVYWALLILLAVLPFFRFARLRVKADFHSAYREEPPPAGRVEYWRTIIRQASLGSHQRRILEQSLEALSLEPRRLEDGNRKLDFQAGANLLNSTQRQSLFQSKASLDPIEAEIGGFILPITPPEPLKPLFERLVRPNYKDIELLLRNTEMEMEINDGPE